MWRNFLNLTNFLNEPCSNNVRFLSHFEEFLFRKTLSILLHKSPYVCSNHFNQTNSVTRESDQENERLFTADSFVVVVFFEEYCFYGGSQRQPAAEN